MTNKIEPVSKAVAKFFAAQCVGIDNKENIFNRSLFCLIYAHGYNFTNEIDYQKFGTFCRAVADQLDSLEEATLTDAAVRWKENMTNQEIYEAVKRIKEEEKRK